MGCTASSTKNECLTHFYGFMGMTVMLIFICLAIAIIILKNTFSEEMASSCANQSGMMYQIDTMYSDGEGILCTSACPCDANSADWGAEGDDMVTSSLGQSKLTDCPVDGISDYDSDHYEDLLVTLESYTDCAGMCTVPKYYLFSEVDKGPPSSTCVDDIEELLQEYGVLTAVVLFLVGFLGLFTFGFSFTLYYLRKKGIDPKLLMKFQKFN
eukprot:CAMPEP_0202964820 /NCGR_PEP_ID=MMETSP1396-20130829/8914_1 /ASSEMBLY_ACC=CAM_ASM_000872 /TAXON_ID= /ORGANISM="Pseudokeronopsis sp., Strain Brazil" /LENGTH=211 /DNA_ID=CAMNT_0049687209 /DNA_START=169 /DNA_END=804 /DNA_ORIENTATION=+